MKSIAERLEASVAVIGALERKREDMKSPAIGRDTEWMLIERELREIEQDILRSPGPLEKLLSRARKAA